MAEQLLSEDRTSEVMTVNMGPHHPATHGVLRLVVDLEGEVVRDLKPVIGYVHTGIEKSCEDKSYWKVIPFVERMDYVSYFFQMEAYCGAVERLVGLEIPPRAKYLRTIFLELNRIHSHLVWLGTTALDLGAISMLWYCFRERDRILDLFEMATGQRMHTRYFQVGGVIEDIPLGFEAKLREFVAEMPVRVGQYQALLDRNEVFLSRTKGTGIVSRERLLELGVTGPLLRAAGEPWDLRKAFDYLAYPEMDFQIPVGTVGDNYDRYRVRVAEMVESTRIVEQALDALPDGPFIADDRKYVLPPRSELSTSMESLIHHFKLVTEGYRVAPGELYYVRQSAGVQGHVDGHLHRRHDLQPRHARPDPGWGRPMSPVDGPGISNPNLPVDQALTEGRVPDRASEQVPELHEVDCPTELRERIEQLMSRYPDRKSASIPALWAVQRLYGWCTPEGIRQAAAVMRVTPAYLESVASFYDLLHTDPVGTHKVAVCTNISCWMRGGDELLDAFRAASEGDEDFFVTGFECLGACDIAPMASIDERYFGPLENAEAATAIEQLRSGADVLPEKALEKRPLPGGPDA
jgi:NADH-quinone oxidoreductase subunit D